MSSTGMPERFTASSTASRPSSNALKPASDPRRAVPIGVRAAATMTASAMAVLPARRSSSCGGVRRGAYLTLPSGPARVVSGRAGVGGAAGGSAALHGAHAPRRDRVPQPRRRRPRSRSTRGSRPRTDSRGGSSRSASRRVHASRSTSPPTEVLRWIVSYSAVHKAGAVVVPTNTRLTVPELVTVLCHAEASVMLTCDELLPTAARRARAGRDAAHARRRRPALRAARRRPDLGRRARSPTAASTRCRSSSRTSPTSCTRRGRPASPRGSPCVTATSR